MKEQKRHYYVDEAGDLTLFNKKGKVIIGQKGCSKLFFLGTAHIIDPPNARKELALLKIKILSDPYLKDKFIKIIDLEDKRFKDYGVYYDSRNELTLQKIRDSFLG